MQSRLSRASAAAALLGLLLVAAGLPPAAAQDEYLVERDVRVAKGDGDIPCGGQSTCRVCGAVAQIQAVCDANQRCQGFTFYPDQGCGYLKSINGPLLSCVNIQAPCSPARHYARASERRRHVDRRTDRRLRMLAPPQA